MASVTSNLFSGAAIPPTPTGSDTATSYPAWLQAYVYNLANAAQGLAGSPYTPYTGQKVATPSAATQQSWGMATGNVGNWQPNLGYADAYTASAGAPITGDDIGRFFNPYTDKVIGGLTDASNRNLFNTVLPRIQSQFVSAGQSRSPQEMQFTADALRGSQDSLNNAIAGAQQTGWQGALNAAMQGKQMQQTAGAQIGQLGALRQQLGAADTGQVAAAGQAQDTVNQTNVNSALNDWYAQQQWPYQNLGFASNIIRGLPVNTNTQTVGMAPAGSTSYAASPLSSFLGASLGARSLGYRQGGEVTRRRVPRRRSA